MQGGGLVPPRHWCMLEVLLALSGEARAALSHAEEEDGLYRVFGDSPF